MKLVGKAQHASLANVWEKRWLARTDLLWLCQNVLDYTLVDPVVHGPLIRHLQTFPIPSLEEARASDLILNNGTFQYTPWCDPYVSLTGLRRKLTLDSRGWYKTSVATVAHTIQWLLNCPHIAMGIFFATDGKAQDVLKNGVKRHFQTNKKLRELFPEYCPQRRVMDWGTAEEFTLECRDAVLHRMKLPPRVEPSVKSLALDKSMVGYHFDVIKCSDLVDNKNCISPTQRAVIANDFGMMPKLLVKRHDGTDGWVDVEGTFYHPEDLHNFMIKEWRAKPAVREKWQIFVRGVFERDVRACVAVGIEPRTERRYDPDEMLLPFLKTADGKRVSVWPSADPIERLEKEEVDPNEGGAVFYSQRVLDMDADTSSNRPFQTGLVWKPAEDYKRIPLSHRVITCDFADTSGPKSNPSVITTSSTDRRGTTYVENIERGWWSADETVRRLLDEYQKATQRFVPVRVVSIEDYAYVHGLKPTIERACAIRKLFPPFHYLKRDRAPNGKLKRILNALTAPVRAGELVFVDPINADPKLAQEIRTAVTNEFRECTSYSTGGSDDVLDTLADIFILRQNPGLNWDARPDEDVQRILEQRQKAQAWEAMLYPETDQTPNTLLTGW